VPGPAQRLTCPPVRRRIPGLSVRVASPTPLRPELEKALANEDLQVPLRELHDPDRVAAVVRPLYQVLDGTTAPSGVKGTTLSKILHRKRPQTLVLHDTWVRACYVGEEDTAPVPRAQRRSWAEYVTLLSVAIGDDLRTQRDLFTRLDAATGAPGTISDVRLLDILAWMSKGAPPSNVAADRPTTQAPSPEGTDRRRRP
jgi:Family of unknown function (DUF6308)